MRRSGSLILAAALVCLGATTAPTTAPTTRPATPVPTLPPATPMVPPGADLAKRLYDAASPALVAVQYTFTGEVQQADVIVAGVVIDESGLVMFPLAAVNDRLPDEQLKKFKVIVPHLDQDNEELDATFEGRDERSELAFVRVKPAKGQQAQTRHWTAIHFGTTVPDVGRTVYSVGMMPRSGGYHTFLTESKVAAHLRGPVKQVLVAGGGLSAFGSPVFDERGVAIGLVGYEPPAAFTLDDRNPQQQLLGSLSTNRYFIPTSEFAIGLADPPSADHPVAIAFTGLPELSGLKKEEAEYLGLTGQPAVQVGDVLPDSPAAKGGLKARDIIVKFDGRPLERGDTPEELPQILRHSLAQMRPGDVITLGVLRGQPGTPLTDVKITLAERPPIASRAKRYWSDDIGFGVREPVLLDRYARKMKPADADGVVVTVLKPESTAQAAGLQPEDMVVAVNGTPTPKLDAFKTAYGDFRKAHAHDAIVMVVKRDGREQTIRIEPPQ